MDKGMQETDVNETVPTGVIFVTRPPDLREEPDREDLDQASDDARMEQVCGRIQRVRQEDLSAKGAASWKALEQLHHNGRLAASVPSLPHTITVDEHSFAFDGCPQPLRPLLHDLMIFERPLITWDIFSEAPPTEFCAPAALLLTGPAHGTNAAASCEQAPLAIGCRRPSSSAAGKDGEPLPTATLPPPCAQAASSSQASGASSAGSASSQAAPKQKPLRDPRIANTVSHEGYTKSAQARDGAELSFEEWTETFPGRVETVGADRLYIVKLVDADGEFHLGLVVSEGKVIDRDGGPHMKALWFKRCNDDNHSWGQNPEFEQYKDGKGGRVSDELPTESFLLEVDDKELTDSSVTQKWSQPKFKQTLMKKLRWMANKYKLTAAAPTKAKPPAAKRRRS